METVGERLRRLRIESHRSMRDLSEPGVSYAYISRIEAGARRPSVKALRMLAAKLGVSAEYLETGTDDTATDALLVQVAALIDGPLLIRVGEDEVEVACGEKGHASRSFKAASLTAALWEAIRYFEELERIVEERERLAEAERALRSSAA